MNFDDTPQEAAFRAQAKAWIAANAPKQYEDELRKSSLGRTRLEGVNILEVAKAWQKTKADAGWACLHWPKEYGGRGASPIERVIWQQEEGAVRQALGDVHHRPWHVWADHDGVRSPRSRSANICRRSPPARKSGASCFPNRPAAPTSRACAPARRKKATTGSSTARRSGPRARIIPTTAFCSRAPIPMCRSTRASPCSSWT